MPRGQLYNDGKTEIWIKTWGEIIDGCKARMKFVQDHLQANVDRESSLKYLKQTYEKLLTGVAEEYAPELEEDDEASAAS